MGMGVAVPCIYTNQTRVAWGPGSCKAEGVTAQALVIVRPRFIVGPTDVNGGVRVRASETRQETWTLPAGADSGGSSRIVPTQFGFAQGQIGRTAAGTSTTTTARGSQVASLAQRKLRMQWRRLGSCW